MPVLGYFREIWDFLLFIGRVSSFIVILIGAILLFVQVKVGKLTGNKLILGGDFVCHRREWLDGRAE